MHRRVVTEDLARMPYLDQVLKESLRHRPSVPYIARKVTEPCVIDGHTLPIGLEVSIMNYNIHHHPDYWPEAERFDPERFSKEAERGHPFRYVPFSAGSRNCIGQKFAMQEMKVIVCRMVKSFRLVAHDPQEEVLMSGEIILRPTHALNMTVTPR